MEAVLQSFQKKYLMGTALKMIGVHILTDLEHNLKQKFQKYFA